MARKGKGMKELLRTNDPVRLSWVQAALAAEGIETHVFDSHMSIVEGSIGVLPRRLMVADDDHDHARRLLVAVGEVPPTP
ncbi:MAG: putative signal transducing protein [Alphaproteobacteria bacterium]